MSSNGNRSVWAGLDRLIAFLKRLEEPDPRPLFESWQVIIADDNQRGVLEGTDRDGYYMPPVTYRPKAPAAGEKPAKLSAAQRNGVAPQKKRGIFAGRGPAAAGLNNNLTSAEYRRLAGTPLAPRGKFSRVITNLRFREPARLGPGKWLLAGGWVDVVSTKGVAFLKYHFRGEGRLPKRNLAGVRPTGRFKAAAAAKEWLLDQIRSGKARS